ncbi:NAD(P)H-dependent glycerol-3-phosphate dehydrogenase [Rubrobacter indicoceani]|uniref:NAD(P)H-dependent glycerol-3-phosphate dehydrogenase n=1 Tax=Rubrobacter indicoceani TaxID=2051957 RepID=UPI000E5BF315|nr:glycerol-3-phosphate dehydrogenase [Rubrobacter indicoceani]
MTTVSVLGAGIMASALAFPLHDNGHEIRLVGTHLDREVIDSIKSSGVHPGLDLKLPDGVKGYYLEEAEEAFAGTDIAISGVNSFGVHWAGEQFSRLLKPGMKLIAVTKGLEADDSGNLRILPDVLAAALPDELRDKVSISAIVGPAIAGEVAVRHETCVVFTGLDQSVLDELARTFRTDYYHIWTSTDFIGSEVCAATKNCYAFGGGFADGLLDKEGKQDDRYVRYNYAAALFGQATRELGRWMELLGGDPATPWGLPGVGDMFVTTMGGRNVKAGRLVGAGVPFSEVRDNRMRGVTLEGVAAIRVIGGALEKLTGRGEVAQEDFPLLRHLYDIIERDEPLDMPWGMFFGGEGRG